MAKRKREEYEAVRPELPNDIIRQILPLIPTKTAFCISLLSKSNQFEGAWCSGPEIDLDEGRPQANLDGSIHFTNVLKRYLKFRTDTKDLHPDHSLHKFRVRMAMDDPIREDILEELLNGFAKERSLRELDLSCLTKPRRLSFQTLININYLTSLSLESVPIGADATPYDGSHILLPSLKTMSLKSISFWNFWTGGFLRELIRKSPSLENLSVTSCSFDKSREPCWFHISSRTLKTLKMRDCNFRIILINTCGNLESFTLVSESPDVTSLTLFNCGNSMSIQIREKHLQSIKIVHLSTYWVEFEVDTPNLKSFKFNSKDLRYKCMDGLRYFREKSKCNESLEYLERNGIQNPHWIRPY